jgi:hypothetical protein
VPCVLGEQPTHGRALDEGGGKEARPADRSVARTKQLLLDRPCELIDAPRRQPHIGGVLRVRRR